MARFLGEHECKVDVKGRIILPMTFKKQMPSDAQDSFIVRKDLFENCLVLYTVEDWNKQLDKIRKKINPFNREQNMFLRNYYMGTAELSLDSNNRILVPKRLMEIIGAGRDVMLAGQGGRIEIWSDEEYKKAAMSREELARTGETIMEGFNTEP
jgi:MraZ protein